MASLVAWRQQDTALQRLVFCTGAHPISNFLPMNPSHSGKVRIDPVDLPDTVHQTGDQQARLSRLSGTVEDCTSLCRSSDRNGCLICRQKGQVPVCLLNCRTLHVKAL